MEDAQSQEELCSYMMQLSEEHYMAGWLMGLEYVLWQAVLDEGSNDNIYPVTREETIKLKSLSDIAGGWWVWGSEDSEQRFVTLAEWQVEWEIYVKARKS